MYAVTLVHGIVHKVCDTADRSEEIAQSGSKLFL
jgi:hypothetical protein